MRQFSILLLISGLLVLMFGMSQFIGTELAQEESVKEAKRLLSLTPKPGVVPVRDSEEVAVFKPESGETIGVLSIAKIDAELAIVEGTGEKDLEKGVGHYAGSAFPEQGRQIVLSGHRDTVFRRMGEIEIGDKLVISLAYGDFPYRVVSTKVVSADDRTVIRPDLEHEELIVSTCYPFRFIGNAPDRYIITALPEH